MTTKYTINYLPYVARQGREFTRHADTRDEAEEAVMQLLSAGARILSISCGEAKMVGRPFDELVKDAAVRFVSGLLRVSLALSAAEIKGRFRLAA